MTMPNRRHVLRAMALGGAATALPLRWSPTAAAADAANAAGTAGTAGAPGPFTRPLHIPPVLQPAFRTPTHDVYRMRMREADVEVLPGLRTRLWTFDGQFPGPTLRARRGRPVLVEQTNDLTVPATVHLHGGHVSHYDDGYPTDHVAPGASRVYHYPNDQRSATLWYHDHTHMAEAVNVYRGLAGTYILEDEADRRLRLPAGRYDIPLALRDAQFEADGTLTYDGLPFHATILVNGRPQPYLRVAARRYRFRFQNQANSRIFQLSLGSDDELVQIGSDGGLLPAPNPVTTLPLYPAERADVVIDFSRYPVGSQVLLHNSPNFLPGEPHDIMRFDVVAGDGDDPSRVPDRLADAEELGSPVVRREFVLAFDPVTKMMTINGKVFDPDRVDITPALDTTELWTVTNPDTTLPLPHTFHVHQAQFHVVDRDGRPPSAAESGRKDTIAVNPGERVSFLIRFSEFTGRYVYHCHMLEHSDMGMMAQMELVRG